MNAVVREVLERQPDDDDDDDDDDDNGNDNDNPTVLSFRQIDAAHLLTVIRSVFISFSSLEAN